jgi:N-acyl amino acid synthase of PEP-CTERM/exosortase system
MVCVIYQTYNELFEVIAVETKEELEQAYALRYQVFVEEFGWEEPNALKLEIDEFDERAVHSLLIFKPTGQALGNVRLILPDLEKLQVSFPLQQFCTHNMLSDQEYLVRMGEISRMSISRKFKSEVFKNKVLLDTLKERTDDVEKALATIGYYGLVSLVSSIFHMMKQNNMQGAFAMMEPHFINKLTESNIHCKLIGEPIEHKGLRQPCYIDVDLLLKAKTSDVHVYDIISNHGKLNMDFMCKYIADIHSPFRKVAIDHVLESVSMNNAECHT